MTAELYEFCPVCGQDRLAELPENRWSDDEWVCLDCCAALFVDPVVVRAPVAAASA